MIFLVVRTDERVVEAKLTTCVIISADIGAGARLFVARTVQEALTVSVVRTVGRSQLVAVAVAAADHASHVLAVRRRIRRRRPAPGVALSLDAVASAVVLVVVAEAVLVVTGDVATAGAGQLDGTSGVTLAVAGFVLGTVRRDVVASAVGVNASEKFTCSPGKRRIVGHEAPLQLWYLGAVIVASVTVDIIVTVCNGFAHCL